MDIVCKGTPQPEDFFSSHHSFKAKSCNYIYCTTYNKAYDVHLRYQVF